MDDTPVPPLSYPLIEHAAIARMREALTLADATETSDVLLADVGRHAALLERCAPAGLIVSSLPGF